MLPSFRKTNIRDFRFKQWTLDIKRVIGMNSFWAMERAPPSSRVDSNSVDRMCVVCIHSAGVAWMHLDRINVEFYNGFNQKQIKYNLILVQLYSSRHKMISRCN